MGVNHDEDGLEHDGDGQWPFHTFVEQLIIDMFDPGKHFTRCHHLYNLEKNVSYLFTCVFYIHFSCFL